jgi:hypothetical protein
MTIHEPATLLTDCLLAALAGWLGWRLRRARAAGNQAARWWSLALGLTALSALVGGFYHGFGPNFPAIAGPWWTLTLLVICLVSAAMAMSLLHEIVPAARRRGWIIAVLAKFSLFAILVLVEPRFVVAIIDYGLVMLAWAAAAFLARRAWRHWMFAALALSVLAAAVQQLHWGLSARFNHNDVYHVIQALAIYAFYRAGLRFGAAA